MRQLSEIEIQRIKILTENSIEFTLIEPTQTGLEKSIMDATSSVRSFLFNNKIHDYSSQSQGQPNKVLIDSYFLKPNALTTSTASLYRPNTKNGDPRIWFKGLTTYTNPNDILSLIIYKNKIFVLNLTQIDLNTLISSSVNNPIKDLFNEIKIISNEISDELLAKLRIINKNGPVPSVVNADTSIGRTLETLLGIQINSSQKPDYKGIELKSYRDKKTNRKTLFAQVPNWNMSKFKSSAEVLNNFGYNRNNDFKLRCTVSAKNINSQGLTLIMQHENKLLIEKSNNVSIGEFLIWELDMLHKKLLEKHNETFWIAADPVYKNGIEHFIFKKVKHTKKPIITQFDILLEQGIITLDHLIKRTPTGGASEKGPLFKIKPLGIDLLFPPSVEYVL